MEKLGFSQNHVIEKIFLSVSLVEIEHLKILYNLNDIKLYFSIPILNVKKAFL
jgi:hypothetical protein